MTEDERIEAAARALCIENGEDPNQVDDRGNPRWHWKCRFARAALAAADGRMVLADRIELSTSSLPMKCSTTELCQQTVPNLCHRIIKSLSRNPLSRLAQSLTKGDAST